MRRTRRARAVCLSAICLFAISAIGCDDFYSDSPPLNTAPMATRPANIPSDPVVAIEQAARTAISERIGIAPEAPRLLDMAGVTWTSTSHGCFPFDTVAGNAQLVPGVSAQFEYESIVYRYDADQAGTEGALCESTRRDIPAALATSLFTGRPFLTANPIIFRSAGEAAAYIAANPGAAFNADLVDWPTESLGAVAVDFSDVSLEPLVRGARLSADGTTVTIELTVLETASPQPGLYPLWVFLNEAGTADTMTVEVTVSEAPDASQTPPAFIQR